MRTQADLERLIAEEVAVFTNEQDAVTALFAKMNRDDMETAACAWLHAGVRHIRRDNVRAIERAAAGAEKEELPKVKSLARRSRVEGIDYELLDYRGRSTIVRDTNAFGERLDMSRRDIEAWKKKIDKKVDAEEAETAAWRQCSERIMEDMIIRRAEKMIVTWSLELLNSEFATPDGRRVTWGAATAADHRLRIAMLVRQTVGTAETAALHERALREMGQANVNRLIDIKGETS